MSIRRIEIAGGWYGEALVSGAYAVLVPDKFIETHGGRVDLPGENTLFLCCTDVGGFKMAGQDAGEPGKGTWEWAGSWRIMGPSISVLPQIYDPQGILRIATGSHQGYRYVDDFGALVTGDDTYNEQRAKAIELGLHGIWEFTHHGGVTIGQGNTGCLAIFGDDRRIIEPGDCKWVRFNRRGNQIALTIVKQTEHKTVLLWMDVADLTSFPREGEPPPPPPPPEKPTVTVPDYSPFVRSFIGPRLQWIQGDLDATRAKTFEAVNAGCLEIRKTDMRVGLLEKTGGDRVRDRAADIWLYDLGDGTAQVIDIVNNGEGAEGYPPSAGWGLKDIRPMSQWKEPFPANSTGGGGGSTGGGTTPGVTVGQALDSQIADIVKVYRDLAARVKALEERPSGGGSEPSNAVKRGETIALKSDHGKYGSVQPDGTVVFDRDNKGPWEELTVE